MWRLATFGGLVACGRVGFEPLPIDDALAIEQLELFEGSTGVVIGTLTNGTSIDVTPYAKNGVAVVAHQGAAGSVRFVRGGLTRVEQLPPFSSGGNDGNPARDKNLHVGDNRIAVTAYELDGALGAAGPTLTVDFTIELLVAITPVVTDLAILDGVTGQVVTTVASNQIIDAQMLPAQPMLGAVTTPELIGSVQFSATIGTTSGTEDWWPYARPLDPMPGSYSITLRPYTLGDRMGTPGTPFTRAFTIN